MGYSGVSFVMVVENLEFENFVSDFFKEVMKNKYFDIYNSIINIYFS